MVYTLIIQYNENKWTANFSNKINLIQGTCSLLLFEIASSSELEVESANGSKQYDEDETTKCHVWSESVVWKPGQFINSVTWFSFLFIVFQVHFNFMVLLSLQGNTEQVHLEFTHDELYAFSNQVCGFCWLLVLAMGMCFFLEHLPDCLNK